MIRAHDITKTFPVRSGRLRRLTRLVEAVDHIDLTVESGEMVGYIGPNGAGKSTTIKMMTGILAPTSGELSVLGLEPVSRRKELARRIGVVFGQRTQLWWDLPLGESFDLLHRVYRTSATRHRENLSDMIEVLDVRDLLDVPVRQLSLGQRMRGELIGAMLHDPEILFLDEPTIGLDVVSKHAVRGFLGRLNRERGTTVILTTHDLADIEHLCRRMVIVDHGRIVYDGELERFRSEYGSERTVVVDLMEPVEAVRVPKARSVDVDGVRQWVRFDRRETTAAEVIAGIVGQVEVRDVTVEEPRIEDLVRHLYTGGE